MHFIILTMARRSNPGAETERFQMKLNIQNAQTKPNFEEKGEMMRYNDAKR